MRTVRFAMPVAVLGLAVMMGGGCAAFRQSVDNVDPDKTKAFDAKYDYSDMRTWSDEMARRIAGSEFLGKMGSAPVVAIFDIENRTTLHVDTQAITDTMRTRLLNSGKMRFVNTTKRDALLKEQEYQGKHASEQTRVAVSKQLGAKYMLTGSLVELKKKTGRQVRVSEKEEIYYQLTVELTDLQTDEVVWTDQLERARKESRPLIGW